MSWLCVMLDTGDTHVVPECDLRTHELTARCWCQPERDVEEPSVIAHQALDQRELYETGALRPH